MELLQTAKRFADALDAEDYAAARMLLAEDGVYRIGGATILGPDAIIESYRTNGEMAKERFDSIEYTSEVSSTGPATATILFKDLLHIGDERHEFHCRQRLRINSSGLIDQIDHEELPQQRELLRAFEARRRK